MRRLAGLFAALVMVALPLSARAQGDGFTFWAPVESVVSGHYYTSLPMELKWSFEPPGGMDARVLLKVTAMTVMGNHQTTYAPDHEPTLVVWQLPAQLSGLSSYTLSGTIKTDMGYACSDLFPGANVTSLSYYFASENNLDGDGTMQDDCDSLTVVTTFGSG